MTKSEYPKLLVSTIPAWNQRSGANTFSTLLSQYPSERLANIYTKAGLPDSDVCSRYFRIIENNVIKSIFNHKLQTGTEVTKVDVTDNIPGESLSEKRRYDFFSRHRWHIFLWLRELFWRFGRWKSKELDEFIEDFKPEVLLFHIESYWYFNRLNKYIISKAKPKKVIGYLWDDNFTYKQYPNSILFKIERFFLRKQVKQLVKSCSSILTISPKMKEECDKEFGINSIVLTKPIFNQDEFRNYNINKPIKILYTGKLIIGRDITIARIVNAIQHINRGGTKIILDVYTQTMLSPAMRQKIDIPESCILHEPVPQEKVLMLQQKADVLLFAESLSKKDLTARLSFSTKLTDYFAAGKCVWAVGNEDLGPIDYIKRLDAGLVSSNDESIHNILEKMVANPNIIMEYAHKAYNCGRLNHNAQDIINKLYTVIGN